jgi:FtsZ-binding cell division protein ZapB
VGLSLQIAARLAKSDDLSLADELERLRVEVDELKELNAELEISRQSTAEHARLEIQTYKRSSEQT